MAPGYCGAHFAASSLLVGTVLAVAKMCKPSRVHCGDVQINLPWVSACGCVFSSSSRESRLKITTAAFIQDEMKGLLALLCDEPHHDLCWNTACTSYGTCLSVFQNTGQAREYLNRCEEGSGTWTKRISEDKHNLYSSPDIMSVTLLKIM